MNANKGNCVLRMYELNRKGMDYTLVDLKHLGVGLVDLVAQKIYGTSKITILWKLRASFSINTEISSVPLST